MTRPAVQTLCRASALFVALLVVAAALADPPKQPPAEPNKDKPDNSAVPAAEEAARREAKKLVGQIDLEVQIDGQWTKAERIEEPLLYYVHPLSSHVGGSLWGWGRKGRPAATLEMWQWTTNRSDWGFALCNTSGAKVRAKHAGAAWWRENESATELKDIPDAPAPAAQSSGRLRQMKLLAQKFTAHEFWEPNNTRYELRRLERPVATYRDEAAGLLDGGLFVLANGTNPEVTLFVEARADPKGDKKPVWQYAIGRTAHAEFHVEHAGKEVFDAPSGYGLSAADRPYWLGYFPRSRVIERKKD